MQLSIHYSGENARPVQAACISGTDPADWLREINRWCIPLNELDCYLFPETIRTNKAAGLFVVFKKPNRVTGLLLKEPYTRIGSKLYLPADAVLRPEIDGHELEELLSWECQLFHPQTGFVGFEEKDKFDLLELLDPGVAIPNNWNYAHPGALTCPPLLEIRVVPPPADTIIDEIKSELGAKPLEEIPLSKEESTTFFSRLLDRLRMAVLWVLKKMVAFFMYIIPAKPSVNGEEGVLNKFERWIAASMGDLQKKRNKELNRLLRLFEENTDEAIRYAIPLDSPYLNRGVAAPSSKLGRRNTNYDPFAKVQSGPADFWDASNYYNDLRKKYLDAALKEKEKKHFKKAAYIYAELLADFKTAALVLQEGRFYREAAVVYQSKLNNKAAAAECLVEGGLYQEAITLYKELYRIEEAGDLYARINDEVNAKDCWEKFVSQKLEQKDHVEAARVVKTKLNDTDRAMDTLLQGWRRSHQAETCLRGYMELSLEKGAADTAQRLQSLQQQTMARQQRISLFNVLQYIHTKHQDEVLSGLTTELAYTLVHEEAEVGNLQLLPQLKDFISPDRLFASDASRYMSSNHGRLINERMAQTIHLNSDIRWIEAIWHGFQFLVLGIQGNNLQLARGNWYGNLEYYSWPHPLKSHTRYSFIYSTVASDHIFLVSDDEVPVTRRNLPKNKYFSRSLLVYCPVWLHKCRDLLAITGDNQLARIKTNDGVTISVSQFDGTNTTVIPCKLENGSRSGMVQKPDALISHGDQFYCWGHKSLITIQSDGRMSEHEFDTGVRFIAGSGYYPVFYLIISTNKGCLLYAPLNMKTPEDKPYFAVSLIPYSASFVDADHFVLAEKQRIHLFLINDEGIPELLQSREFSSMVVAVMPTNEQKQYAVIEENGRVSRHSF